MNSKITFRELQKIERTLRSITEAIHEIVDEMKHISEALQDV